MFALLPFIAIVQAEPRPLTLGDDGTFTVVQFADLHFGEGEQVAWGPQQDANSTRVMTNVIAAELAPHCAYGGASCLAVFSGDQITGNNINTNATVYWSQLLEPVVDAGVAFASIMGNHDDAPLQPSDASGGLSSVTTRAALVQFESSTFPTLSHARAGPDSIHGVTNYLLPLRASASNASVAAAVLALDSGGGSYPEVLFADQVQWARATLATLPRAVPVLVFVHIPMPQYANAYVPLGPGSPCVGVLDADGITPTLNDTGLFAALAAAQNVRAVFVGHDHGNAWCCPLGGMQLCYGRHTGYGGYGDWDRGARVLRLTRDAVTADVHIDTWVRMEDGSVNSLQSLA